MLPASMQGAAIEEVKVLQTEVARLQAELATTTEQLEAASAAAEAERSGQSFHLPGLLLNTAIDAPTLLVVRMPPVRGVDPLVYGYILRSAV